MTEDWWDAMETEAIGWALMVLVPILMISGAYIIERLKRAWKERPPTNFRNWRF